MEEMLFLYSWNVLDIEMENVVRPYLLCFMRISAKAFSITVTSDGSACMFRSKRFSHFI